MPTLTIRRENDGERFEVRIGRSIDFELEENPTTGYLWSIEKLNEDVVKVQHREFVALSGAMIGGGGIRKIQLKAIAVGETPIQLKLLRKWESKDLFIDGCGFTIRVYEDGKHENKR
jgi:inhibitor of cysteine peptidase